MSFNSSSEQREQNIKWGMSTSVICSRFTWSTQGSNRRVSTTNCSHICLYIIKHRIKWLLESCSVRYFSYLNWFFRTSNYYFTIHFAWNWKFKGWKGRREFVLALLRRMRDNERRWIIILELLLCGFMPPQTNKVAISIHVFPDSWNTCTNDREVCHQNH